MINTEDKIAWCQAAEDDERDFVINRLPQIGLTGNINPAKATDRYTHDIHITLPADLKSVRTPLFKAQELYGIDPQYAVTFNDKDGQRYAKLYPNLLIVFDVQWTTTSMEIGGTRYTVQPMHATHAGFLADIRQAIVKDGNNRHHYSRRRNDQSGNAKESWVFDIRHLKQLA